MLLITSLTSLVFVSTITVHILVQSAISFSFWMSNLTLLTFTRIRQTASLLMGLPLTMNNSRFSKLYCSVSSLQCTKYRVLSYWKGEEGGTLFLCMLSSNCTEGPWYVGTQLPAHESMHSSCIMPMSEVWVTPWHGWRPRHSCPRWDLLLLGRINFKFHGEILYYKNRVQQNEKEEPWRICARIGEEKKRIIESCYVGSGGMYSYISHQCC